MDFAKFEHFLRKNKNNLLIIGGVVLSAIIIHRVSKRKRLEKESKSDFIGSPFGQTVQFTISNNSPSQSTATLFDAFNVRKGSGISISPDIGFFNRNLIAEPIQIKNIQIRSVSGNNNIDSPILVQTIEANGEQKDTYLNPMVSPFQKQGNIVTVEPSNLILTGNTTLNFSMNPNSSISVIFTYDIVSSRTEELHQK